MRLTAFLLLAPFLVAAMPEPVREIDARIIPDTSPVEAGDALEARDLNPDLTKRACKSNGCKCLKGYPGVWCGNCVRNGAWVVEILGSSGSQEHVYQCSSGGGCCDYGYATDCKGGATGRCG